ncbi:MAG: hypothetical protein JWN17_3165 [Frankiales bacterium]|nr:hypothetical protein [Frankiales bacterium]
MVVTGGDEPLGRAVVDALLRRPGEVRAVVSSRAGQRALVPLGVRTACVDLVDVDVLAAVLAGASTLVHVAGEEPADTLGPLREACALAGVERVVVVTERDVPGAVRPGPDAVAQVLLADDRS